MGKYRQVHSAVTKDANGRVKDIDYMPVKPQGDCYGKQSSYFDQERWRKDKTAWVSRQETREKAGGRFKRFPGWPDLVTWTNRKK